MLVRVIGNTVQRPHVRRPRKITGTFSEISHKIFIRPNFFVVKHYTIKIDYINVFSDVQSFSK